jgi:DNA-binding transcriptional ArsR family regulator
MVDIPYIAEVASLIGIPARADMLLALKNDGVLSATELAHVAGVAPNTASEHLAKLAQARLIAVERQGRHRPGDPGHQGGTPRPSAPSARRRGPLRPELL